MGYNLQGKSRILFLSLAIIDILLYLFAFGNEKTEFAASIFILLSLPVFAYFGNNSKTNEKSKNNDRFYISGILLITVFLYIPTLKYGFTNWDDTDYVVNNHLIKSLSLVNLSEIFTESFKGMYQPLSILSLYFDFLPARLNPIHYHLTNIILHIANTYLIFKIIKGIFKNLNIAIISALLFGIHTVHTESVIWVSERKDVLYTLFFLLSIYQYLIYSNSKSSNNYYYSILFFFLSLLSKPQGVMLPFVLILIDYISENKSVSNFINILRKSPYFALSLIFGILVLYLGEGETPQLSIFERIAFGLYAYTEYIVQIFVPINLSVLYPYPGALDFIHYLYAIFTIIILIWTLSKVRKNKSVFFGIMFFSINIVLLLQFIPNTYVIRADRYNYIASVGIFILLGILFNYLIKRFKKQKSGIRIFGVALVALLLLSSFNRGEVWKSSISLWNDTLDKYPDVAEALNNRGHALYMAGDSKAALKDFNEAIKSNPRQANALINRGTLYLYSGKFEQAKYDLSKGLAINPEHISGLINRGIAFINTGQSQKAMGDFDKAISVNPYATEAYINRGSLYESMSDFERAIKEYDRAIEIDPDNAMSYANRGLAYARSGNENRALYDFNICIKKDPKYADAYSNRGFIYFKLGNYNQAIVDLSRAIKIKPESATAFMNRGKTYIALKDINKACPDFQMAYSLGLEAAGPMISMYCTN